MSQDRLLKFLKLPARLDPELLGEGCSRGTVGLECLRLAAGPVEGDHQQFAQPLAQRMLGDEALELAHQLRVPAQLQVGAQND